MALTPNQLLQEFLIFRTGAAASTAETRAAFGNDRAMYGKVRNFTPPNAIQQYVANQGAHGDTPYAWGFELGQWEMVITDYSFSPESLKNGAPHEFHIHEKVGPAAADVRRWAVQGYVTDTTRTGDRRNPSDTTVTMDVTKIVQMKIGFPVEESVSASNIAKIDFFLQPSNDTWVADGVDVGGNRRAGLGITGDSVVTASG